MLEDGDEVGTEAEADPDDADDAAAFRNAAIDAFTSRCSAATSYHRTDGWTYKEKMSRVRYLVVYTMFSDMCVAYEHTLDKA